MSEFPLPRILEFIRTVTPFDGLDEPELAEMAGQMEIAYFPRGQAIMRRGDDPPGHLHIIRVGSARITISDELGQEILVDVRGEGDCFGALNVLEAKRTLFDVSADEDLIIYLLPAKIFKQIVELHPAFKEYFGFSLARDIRAVHQSAESRLEQTQRMGAVNFDMFLIGKKVGDLMRPDVLCCPTTTSIRAAAQKMTRRGVSSIIVLDGEGIPVGIVTDSDLRAKVIAAGHVSETPVTEIMAQPLHTIEPDAYAFDALLDMSRFGVSHLLVTHSARLAGILSEHDFQMETGSSPVGVIGDIEKSQTITELVGMQPKVNRVLEMLLRQGGSVKRMVDLVSELNDRVSRRLLQLVEAQMAAEGLGCPPAPYTWMALGSEGRREQTLLTDQDNALLFAAEPGQDLQTLKPWFLKFAERVVDGLVQYGFPRCPGGIMASNPQWCQTEADWERTFMGWIARPEPVTLRMSTIFFDFRAIYAGTDFLKKLRLRLNEAIDANPHFLRALSKVALYNRPPLGFLRSFVVEKSGEHKNKLNLKMRGLVPVVDAGRVIALDLGLLTTNTFERLSEATERGALDNGLHNDLKDAYGFINLLRISHHLKARSQGRQPNNFVDPVELNSLQRKMLKESFGVINRLLQELVEWRYQAQAVEEP